MKWATRKGIHVDRAASAWLITSWIDADAEFVYVDDRDDVPDDATPFDMRSCELSHVGTDITFETILRKYELIDPVLWEIAKIIHQADVEDDMYDAPAAAGIDVLIRALHADHTDEEVRKITATLLTSLYEHIRTEALRG